MEGNAAFHPRLIKGFNYSDEIFEVMEIEYTDFGSSGGRKGKQSHMVNPEDRERNQPGNIPL